MSEPSAESLAWARREATRYFAGSWTAFSEEHQARLALAVDAYVAERTAALRKDLAAAVQDTAMRFAADICRRDERETALRAAADAMAQDIAAFIAEKPWYAGEFPGLDAYRTLSPAGEGDPPCPTG